MHRLTFQYGRLFSTFALAHPLEQATEGEREKETKFNENLIFIGQHHAHTKIKKTSISILIMLFELSQSI